MLDQRLCAYIQYARYNLEEDNQTLGDNLTTLLQQDVEVNGIDDDGSTIFQYIIYQEFEDWELLNLFFKLLISKIDNNLIPKIIKELAAIGSFAGEDYQPMLLEHLLPSVLENIQNKPYLKSQTAYLAELGDDTLAEIFAPWEETSMVKAIELCKHHREQQHKNHSFSSNFFANKKNSNYIDIEISCSPKLELSF